MSEEPDPRSQHEADYLKYSAEERKAQKEYLELLNMTKIQKLSWKNFEKLLSEKKGEKLTAQHLKKQARIAMGVTKQYAWQMERRRLRVCTQCMKPDTVGLCDECRKKVWKKRNGVVGQ